MSAATESQAIRLGEIRRQFADSIAVKTAALNDESLLRQLERLTGACVQALRAGHKVIFAGNGGSFADAQHLSAEFTSRFLLDRAPLPSLALGTNSSAMSAIGNDYGYEQVFARELEAIAHAGDVFVPISTSGNSANILAAIDVATRLGITTVAWSGSTGGKLQGRCECMCIPATETARIQECHILMGHILCSMVEEELFRNRPSSAGKGPG
ncbi:MAG: SIS domain-containing protein [Steroidobacteraceae bacterium]